MPYIHFTEEQKLRAGSVDLVEFLRRQGEKLIRSGPEYRMTSDHSVTVRGNEWYDHATGEGGGPVSFVQNFYHLSYPEAVTRLLEIHYATVFHGLIGVVAAATVVIIPFTGFAAGIGPCLINLGCLCLGIAAAQMLNRFNASVSNPE